MDFVKKNDKIISLGVFILTVIFVFVFTRSFFLEFAQNFPLFGGFIKFFFLASLGDFIGLRLKVKTWRLPHNIFYKALVWGFIGSVIVLMFGIFEDGTWALVTRGILPNITHPVYYAFLVSLFMNIIFAPTMMAFHRISDTYLDGASTVQEAISSIDWVHFYRFVLLRTIPFFWIPAHTITFILPSEYRVIFAALLGIVLGVLLRIFKN
jgi:hypothetical protein